ncbi:hypothetical protein DKX38_021368 [Salix brachista]|uniref:RNA helicase n=1 Tax=Salix brachista TaxID=2182728 RepID=A0A5N5K7J2_9ROSI|nr:hypothetical protein DKX38_021368 [Salix brachista]
MKNKASVYLKRIMSVLASMVKAKTLALKSKTNALRTRLIIFSLLGNKKIMMSSLTQKLQSVMGKLDKDQEEALELEYSDQNKAVVLYNQLNSMSPLINPTRTEMMENVVAEDDQDNIIGYGYEESGEDEEKYPDLTHSLFESEDADFEDSGVSVIDMVKNSKQEGEAFSLEDEIDHVADLFIKRFHRQMWLQKQLSMKRSQEMLKREEDVNRENQGRTSMNTPLVDELTASEAAGDDVKKTSRDQREALTGEPICVVCGRYGEYICDQTDSDICSLECKQTLLGRAGDANLPVGLPLPKRLAGTDECFYVRDSESLPLTSDQTELLRRKLEIHVKGASVPDPILSFSSCNLPEKLLHNIQTLGYDMPTPIQMQGIAAALTGKSLLASADTGSGKTASFLVPVVSRCVTFRHGNLSKSKKPLAMVLTPTRELCIQIEDQAKLLGKGLPFKTALVIGGDAMARQLYRIQQGVELIVGTPGRLIDLLAKHDIELDDIMILVLDEVDCMLQKGFRDQVMQIFVALSQPQVLMYSATTSQEVEKMASAMAKDLIFVSIGQPNRPSKAVKQLAIWVESKQKKQKLFDILMSKQHFLPPAIVYVGSRIGADLLTNAITVTTGLKALSIHGEKSMKERREIMRSYLVGEVPLVVATGVLGRGVDLLGVRQVIVFDMPNSIKEYVHQIGRASRMGEDGTSFVFVNEENKNLFPDLVEVLKSSGAVIPRELVNSSYATRSFPMGKGQRKRKHG